MVDEIVIKLDELEFREVDNTALRRKEFKEIVEYWNGNTWRTFAK